MSSKSGFHFRHIYRFKDSKKGQSTSYLSTYYHSWARNYTTIVSAAYESIRCVCLFGDFPLLKISVNSAMPFDKFANSNQMSTWCKNVTTTPCPVDCGDIFQIIRASWYQKKVATFVAMLILVASFVHFILYVSPRILRCLLKSSNDSYFKSECSSVGLSAEILEVSLLLSISVSCCTTMTL